MCPKVAATTVGRIINMEVSIVCKENLQQNSYTEATPNMAAKCPREIVSEVVESCREETNFISYIKINKVF